MIWPTVCIDNFFDNPDKVVEAANSFPYKKDETGKWPGKRCEHVGNLHYELFLYSTKKIVASIFPNEYKNLQWNCTQYFQKIKSEDHKGPGWVHKDDQAEFTCIIYLSKNPNNGTSLFSNNNFFNYKKDENTTVKWKYIKENKTSTSKIYQNALKDNNSNFTKTCSFNSIYNRMILFDSHQSHGVDNFDNEDNEERLTLITFFYDVSKNDGALLKKHGTEHRRI